MYQGKYHHNRKRRLRWGRGFLIACAAVVMLVGIIGGTLAYLYTNSAPVKNIFTRSGVACQVMETFNGSAKTNVAVQNTGNTDAYVRAVLVISWQDADGNLSGVPVTASDYVLALAPDSGWVKSGSYYYYTNSVAPGASTPVLISSLTPAGTAPEGYSLCVEVLAEAIQSKGTDSAGQIPAKLAWGVDPSTLV